MENKMNHQDIHALDLVLRNLQESERATGRAIAMLKTIISELKKQ